LSDAPDPSDAVRAEALIAESVVDYVTRHPQAMDTVEGIAAWWLRQAEERVNVGSLQRVLDRLTEEGILERIDASDRVHYRLHRPTKTI
jgi:Fe2+ or Zn2+ uptake regulation protein